MLIYQLGYFWVVGYTNNLAPSDAHLRAPPSRKGVETPKLHQQFPYVCGVGIVGKPYLQTEFSQKFRFNPPPPGPRGFSLIRQQANNSCQFMNPNIS